MTNVHLISVIGGDPSVVPHMIQHYRDLGIESFILIRHAESRDSETYARAEAIVRDAGLSFAKTHVGPWDDDLNGRLIEAEMMERPDDWFVIADADEFQVYDRPLTDLVKMCERQQWALVEGCFLDRLARDGTFPSITAAPLWDQFPLAGMISFPLLGATPTKVVLARGRVQLESGHHRAKNGVVAPHRDVYAQVHHFKWNDSVVERMRYRKERFQSGAWKLLFVTVIGEVIRFLDHITAHDGKIDVDEPLFMLEESHRSFDDYPHWTEVKRLVHTCWPAGW
jgi:hypothetical protein